MIYRISYYLEPEIVNGRAPRYMVDIEASTLEAAKKVVQGLKPDVIIRSGYKAPQFHSADEVQQRIKERIQLAEDRLKNPNLREDCGNFINKPYSGNTFPHPKDDTLCRKCLTKFIEVQSDKMKQPSETGAIRETPSFVFISSELRNKWYGSTGPQSSRTCHDCKVGKVERYKRFCADCAEKRAIKLCIGCNTDITNSRSRFCSSCSTARKEKQEKTYRTKRATTTTLERIERQVAWAKEELKTVSLPKCKLSSRYQGLRLPHVDVYELKAEADMGAWVAPPNRCHACLLKFIEVQNVYLSNLLATYPTPELPNVNSHAATV